MTEERWQRVQDLLKQALDHRPEERASFVADACGDDADLRREVESLLGHDEQAAAGFLEPTVTADPEDAAMAGPRAQDEDPLPPSDFIPGYHIIRKIKRGAQGIVYEANQDRTGQRVAIKVMAEGPFSGPDDLARFDREVRILGQLNHPHIVAIHDRDVADGRHFFVMNYIRGAQLDEYMQAHKDLSVRSTVQLFAKICDAIKAAHLNGVIHRDLKAGNIRVDEQGQAYVLDFGLAKVAAASTDPSLLAKPGSFFGTPAWASPEQAEAVPGKVDMRTDVYSLGVILYHMLTGQFPYDVSGSDWEILDNVRRCEPTRPSTHRRELRGDLERIILNCLEKDRDRRYQTGADLHRDVQHYLNGEPLERRPSSVLYLLSKCVRKYKVPAAIASGYVVAMTIGFFVSLDLYGEERATSLEKTQKLAYAEEVGQLLRKYVRSGAGTILLGLPAEDLVRISEELEQLLAGNNKRALELANKGLELHPDDPCRRVFRGYVWLLRYQETGKMQCLNSAVVDYQHAKVVDDRYAPSAAEGVATAYFLSGQATGNTDDYGKAIGEYTTAIELDSEFTRAFSNRGHLYFDLGYYSQAAADYAEAVSVGFEKLKQNVPDPERTYFNYGTARRLLGQSLEAAVQYELAIAAAPDRADYAVALALAYTDLGRLDEADRALEEACEKWKYRAWFEKFARCLLQRLAPNELTAIARTPEQRCKACYYAGEAHLREGAPERAASAFEACLQTGETRANEYRLAEWRLRQLGRATPEPES